MNANVEKQTPPTMPSKSKKSRKGILTLLMILFFFIGCVWFAYWYLVLRHHQETDDAYVAGNQIQIMSQVNGSVARVNVDNTDLVRKGDVLVELDPTDAEQAFERAKTTLANSVRQVHQQMITVRQYQANIDLQQIALDTAISDLIRREALGRANAIGREDLQHARDQVASARASLEAAKQQYAATQALVLNTPLEQQPAIAQAATDLRDAWLALKRTHIVSPVDGYVSRRSVQLGARVTPSSALMAVVPTAPLWVDANFKETQLPNMRIGQPATIISDLYGDIVEYKGKVVGLDMGTGSAFSLLPAQNATGNWIKVVQRLPVRIELDPKQLADYPLRIGLSMLVNVDTANADGKVLSDASRATPAYQSDALDLDLAPVNQMIDQIIGANAG
ncbi:multidrug efflux MFS transporter periplasmic adaptor subunit EmrA [Dickeya dianthicola]|uniref:multidrug efflux MFS transporter periplasmic adaptor subunit EmrA n=1 Tax=Dickeya dianthicola TaxID=204039 RepID=UPI0013719925|nr:multidrug efflux MFS transporter periplasmic adaptor subunit EmrA [Dickeya dianthicola]MCI4188002.1 multidrug efflux MFS transporter periplasmic adaptor subunit EmrA [Dickeya dianthicola]MCI4236743.1 multidrug efflux MFS transporter periplasmic adaptor subunit EmrA [Dickeya dianthicola]MCI4255055.1 multidrug efflux MFS transporter periplasmic adaptor subunit EmrA [Dickeya dianthicola]MZG21557.1 multidrug efflux MFS transporter periplasmic adaptor subunit EmrA [Dickeya dianthicola]MZI90509.1